MRSEYQYVRLGSVYYYYMWELNTNVYGDTEAGLLQQFHVLYFLNPFFIQNWKVSEPRLL